MLLPTFKSFQSKFWFVYLLYGVILLGCLVRVWEVFLHNPINHLFSDPLRHWDHARLPLEASPLAIFDPPLYQLWLSLVQKWSLGIPELIALYAAVLSVVTPWLWYCFLREALASSTLALVGWALLTWLPSWIGIFDYFMTETLLLPLMGASLWATFWARRQMGVRPFLGMVVLWILTGLVRPIAFPLGMIAIFWVWIRHPKKWSSLGWSFLITCILLVPFAYRNYHYTGMGIPYGNGWLNKIYAASGRGEIHLDLTRDGAHWIYYFSSPSMNTYPLAPLLNWTSSRSGSVEVVVDLNQGSEDWRRVYQETTLQGLEKWKLRWENILMLMVGDSWPDNHQSYFSGRASIASRWVWIPLFLITISLCVWHWEVTLKHPLLLALILVWFLLQACSLVAVNEGRYRKPVEGLLIAQLLIWIDQRSTLFPKGAL